MGILEQAIEFEYSGHKLYSENAEKAKNPAVRFILNSLAEDELKHAAFLEKLRDGKETGFTASDSMPKIMNVIKESALKDKGFLSDDKGIIAVLEQALAIEDKARSHYEGEAMKTLDENSKALLQKLALEEEQHYALISNLLRYLDDPAGILETQEFQMYGESE